MRQLIKVFRDLWLTRGRALFMVVALAAGITSIGTTLSMSSVLKREMTRSYLETIPASATFDVGESGLTDSRLSALRQRPEVSWAERCVTRQGRWRRVGKQKWHRALLFGVEDFSNKRLALLKPEIGRRIPDIGSVFVERSAFPMLKTEVGGYIEITAYNGQVRRVRIAGVVHEPALPPATTEQAGYFYADAATIEMLGGPPTFDELRVLVAEDSLNVTAVRTQITQIARWLKASGVTIHEIKIPPPGQHPHQKPSEVVLLMFVVFAGLTLVLASVLCASLLATTMARQVREVAVKKTLGATSAQIRNMYVLMLGTVAFVALLISVLPTKYLGHLGIDMIATLLNFDIVSYAVPWWVSGLQITAAFVLPLAAAFPAIFRASRSSVCEALNQTGARLPKLSIERIAIGGRVLRGTLRNVLRVPRRLLLTTGLMAISGGLLVAAVSLADSWKAMTDRVYQVRHYDVELHLAAPISAQKLNRLAGAATAESWGAAAATVASTSGLPISQTYPDQSHGSFYLAGVPNRTKLVDFRLCAGRLLLPTDMDALVVNQIAAARFGSNPVGKRIDLVVDGRRQTWHIVGVIEEVAAPAVAYVSERAFVERAHQRQRVVRLATHTRRDPKKTRLAIQRLKRAFTDGGVNIVKAVPLSLIRNAMGEHVYVLIRALVGLALMMALVGTIGLASSMSTSVVERTREFGVLRAIGARPLQIWNMVIVEGWFVTLLSLPLAAAIAASTAALMGRIVGQLAFFVPLPLNMSWLAMVAWSVGALTLCTAASAVPAQVATKSTVIMALRSL